MALASDMDSDGDLDIVTTSLATWDSVLAGTAPTIGRPTTRIRCEIYRNDGA